VSERFPERFRADVVRRIGHGGEATVYELTGGRVLRVFHGAPHGAPQIAEFYRRISNGSTSFALPEILDQGEADGVFYSLDRLIPGRALHDLLRTLTGAERARALSSYADAVHEIARLPLVREPYGEFLRDDDSITAVTWNGYLQARMERSLAESSAWLPKDVAELPRVVDALSARIASLVPDRKALVHGDYFPGNVLIGDDMAVSGVIDFGPLTVIGDPWLDLASALMFLEVVQPGYLTEDSDLVRDRLVDRVGDGIIDRTTTYAGWYASRFSPYRDDPNLYRWCVETLKRVGHQLGA
jgi:aminoglycoside phosphotransferase (APT) family kinase protein